MSSVGWGLIWVKGLDGHWPGALVVVVVVGFVVVASSLYARDGEINYEQQRKSSRKKALASDNKIGTNECLWQSGRCSCDSHSSISVNKKQYKINPKHNTIKHTCECWTIANGHSVMTVITTTIHAFTSPSYMCTFCVYAESVQVFAAGTGAFAPEEQIIAFIIE